VRLVSRAGNAAWRVLLIAAAMDATSQLGAAPTPAPRPRRGGVAASTRAAVNTPLPPLPGGWEAISQAVAQKQVLCGIEPSMLKGAETDAEEEIVYVLRHDDTKARRCLNLRQQSQRRGPNINTVEQDT
jgi:hypothetical protein